MKNRSAVNDKKFDETNYAIRPEDNPYKNPETVPGKSRSAKISVPTFDGLQMVSVEEIVKCIAHESYTEIVLTCGSKFMVSRNLKEYEDMLYTFNFFRIHHSYLVNLRHIKKYIKGDGGYVLMVDGHNCEVSRRKKTELLSRLSMIEF